MTPGLPGTPSAEAGWGCRGPAGWCGPQPVRHFLYFPNYYNTYYINASVIPEVTDDLTVKRPPRFIVLWDNEAPSWLWNVMAGRYTLSFSKGRYWVYEKMQKA